MILLKKTKRKKEVSPRVLMLKAINQKDNKRKKTISIRLVEIWRIYFQLPLLTIKWSVLASINKLEA